VISIAHLGDAERMFFMTLLLADILAWVRSQPGTGSLRAILYIDELFGYMPPVANPPSKTLLLTLLKQARAFGLGVVLASQNPVDLDYRGLSNTGTWFIGRLQTERDKMRVMEGLEGASNGQAFDKDAMEKTIAGLGKRVFLLHSVHEPAPVTFETRWTLSYLAGPMTREQIKQLNAGGDSAGTAPSTATATATTSRSKSTAAGAAPAPSASSTGGGMTTLDATPASHAPVLPADVPQFFIPPTHDVANISYNPSVIGIADVTFSSAKYGVTEQRRVTMLAGLDDGPITLEWDSAERIELEASALERGARDGAVFGAFPAAAGSGKSYAAWTKSFQKWLATNEQLELLSSPTLKLISNVDENERDFRIRLQQKSREGRDAKVETLRGKYATKLSAMQERIRRAQQSVEREKAESTQAAMSSAISVGSAILGAVFGRGKISATEVSKIGTAARGVGRAAQQRGDVSRAGETVEALQQQYADLEAQLQSEIDELGAAFDAQTEALDKTVIKAKSGDVHVQLVALAWVPYERDANGMTSAAWK